MSTIPEEIKRIKDNISAAYTSLENKGATMPTTGETSANLAQTINTLDIGSASITYNPSTHKLTIIVR